MCARLRVRESRSLWSDARSRLLRNPVAMAGGAVVILLILVAIAAPYIAPYDPIHQDLANSLAGPSMTHLAGTDVHGRDIFSRIIYGTRISLRIGFLGMLLGCVVGVILGLVVRLLRRLGGHDHHAPHGRAAGLPRAARGHLHHRHHRARAGERHPGRWASSRCPCSPG